MDDNENKTEGQKAGRNRTEQNLANKDTSFASVKKIISAHSATLK